MENLPSEMIGEIASRIAKAAANPMDDLGILRAASSQMRAACGSALVGQSIPLERVLWWLNALMHWEGLHLYYSCEYHANLITRLAAVGHPEACFLVGMRAVFVDGCANVAPPDSVVDMLQRTADSGHQLSRFVLAMVPYRSNSGAANDATTRQILQEIEGTGPSTWSCRNIALHRDRARNVLQTDEVVPHALRPHLGPMALPKLRHYQCRGFHGGCPEYGGYVGPWASWFHHFSEECRIDNECGRFFVWT